MRRRLGSRTAGISEMLREWITTRHHADNRRFRVCRKRWASGATLVEVAVASAILVVGALGALRYEYYAVGQGQIARAQIAATHAASLLLADWKSTGGSVDYDPSRLGLGFSSPRTAPADFGAPEGLGNVLNEAVYTIRQDDVPLTVMLKYLDVNQDAQAEATLRQLAVVVRYRAAGSEPDPDDRLVGLPPVTLATYVRLDATNG